MSNFQLYPGEVRAFEIRYRGRRQVVTLDERESEAIDRMRNRERARYLHQYFQQEQDDIFGVCFPQIITYSKKIMKAIHVYCENVSQVVTFQLSNLVSIATGWLQVACWLFLDLEERYSEALVNLQGRLDAKDESIRCSVVLWMNRLMLKVSHNLHSLAELTLTKSNVRMICPEVTCSNHYLSFPD